MKLLSTILILMSFTLFGQKAPQVNPVEETDFFFYNLSYQFPSQSVSEAALANMLVKKANYANDVELKLSYKISSKALTHFRFKVLKQGTPVYLAEVHVALNHENEIVLCEMPTIPDVLSDERYDVNSIAEGIRLKNEAESILSTELVWYTDQSDMLYKGLQVVLAGPETLHQEVLYSQGKIQSQFDLLRYMHGPNDTLVSVMVFNPDPLTTSGNKYGGSYIDNSDQSVPVLEVERKTKSLVVTYDNGIFRAKNDYVEVKDFSAPNIAPASSTTPLMHYTRDLDGFEDMNVMYHITEHKKHLINLGFPNIPNYTIEVDAHAINGADQSFFSTASNPGRLYFGEGGVDDGEDADVIIHEYMQSVMYVAEPSTGNTTERACIEEALGDYFAASHSAHAMGTMNEGTVFDWDGHNPFWGGRNVVSTKNYALESFKNGNLYSHTDLFASPLIEMYNKLGRNTSDEIILEAIFNLSSTTTMPQMAQYILNSDGYLNGGANQKVIHDAFAKRNILPGFSVGEYASAIQGLEVYNTMAFAAKGSPLFIKSKEHDIRAYKLINSNGQCVYEGIVEIEVNELATLSFDNLERGIYILQLTTGSGKTAIFKLSRF